MHWCLIVVNLTWFSRSWPQLFAPPATEWMIVVDRCRLMKPNESCIPKDREPWTNSACLNLQASRAQILDKATEYIQFMRRKNHTHQQDIDDLKKQNAVLEQQGMRGSSRCLTKDSHLFPPFVIVLMCGCSHSSCAREGQREQPDKLLFWQQLLHKPQRQHGVGLRRGLRLQLWIGAGWASQQEEAARRAQLDAARPGFFRQTLCFFARQLPVCTQIWEQVRWRVEDSARNAFNLHFPSRQASCQSFCPPPLHPVPKERLFWSFFYAFETSW